MLKSKESIYSTITGFRIYKLASLVGSKKFSSFNLDISLIYSVLFMFKGSLKKYLNIVSLLYPGTSPKYICKYSLFLGFNSLASSVNFLKILSLNKISFCLVDNIFLL